MDKQDWLGGPEPKDIKQLENEKVTVTRKLNMRIEEGLNLAELGIKNAGPNASTFWQGYKEGIEFVRMRFQADFKG
jgi:hypothetical protein